MNTWAKRIKRAAIFMLIFVALLLSVKLIRRTFFPRDRAVNAQMVRLGQRIRLPEVDWSKSERTLVLVLNKGCGFCTKSAPFYQKLVQETSNHEGVNLIAVLPHQVNESREYLQTIGVDINNVRQAELESLGLRGTPAIVLVNKRGIITGLWMGQLPQEKEDAVLKYYLNT